MFVSIFTFLIVLSVLILVHECGHFFAARRAGIWVEEFGFGIPPRIFGKKIGETLYSINLFPFGGFVKLHGENSGDEITRPERAFLSKSKKTRSMVVVAGVLMNFLLAIFLFAVTYSFSGVPKELGYVRIVGIQPNSPAESAGLKPEDIVVFVEGNEVETTDEFILLLDEKAGEEAMLTIAREGVDENMEIKITPRADPPEGQGALGVVISDSELYYPPVWQRPFLGIYHGIIEAVFWGTTVILGFIKMFKDLFVGIVPTDVAGPAGLFVITSEIAKIGILPLLSWVGIISINLGILNILPLPALDGGRLLFIGLEKLFGRRVLPKVEGWLHAISLGILILFMLAVTFKEVRMISSLGFDGYLDFLSGGEGMQ